MTARRPRRANPTRVLAAWSLAWLAAGAPAQMPDPLDGEASPSAPARPDSSRRIVQVFDFEEVETNPLPVPRYWFRAQEDPSLPRERPGFPIYNRAELDDGTACSGRASVRLPTRGGSTSLRLSPGVLPIFANADYLITARVRTAGLTHARAAIAARFLDAANAPIAGSDARCLPVLSEQAWGAVAVMLPGDFDRAAYIQVDLELLQPSAMAAGEGGGARHQVWRDDLTGAAWFDDVTVIQLPRVQVSTLSPGNVVMRPEAPELSVFVRDLTGETLSAAVRVQDARGWEVASWEMPISSGRLQTRWRPEIPRLGWYRATLDVSNASGRVGSSYVDFAWLPAPSAVTGGAGASGRPGSGERGRFGVVIGDLPSAQRPQIPVMLRRIGSGAATIPVWTGGTEGPAAALATMVEALLADWQELTFAPHARAEDPGSAGAESWLTLLYPLLDRFGQSVRRWQFGPAGDDGVFRRPDLIAHLPGLEAEIARLVPGPILALPWRAEHALTPAVLDAGRGDALEFFVPHTVTPAGIGECIGAIRASLEGTSRRQAPGFVFDRFPVEDYGPMAAASDLAKRTVEFWNALGAPDEALGPDAARISVLQPWDWVGERRPQTMPRPELPVWRTLVERLADRRPLGSFPAGEGIAAYLFAAADTAPAGRGGVMVVWRTSAAPKASRLAAYLGAGQVTAYDIFGNGTPVAMAEGPAPEHHLEVTDEPLFLEGVDVELLGFLGSVRLEPGFLSSESLQHQCRLVMRNPWGTGMSGRFHVVQPGGFGPGGALDRSWTVAPRSGAFTVPAGAWAEAPLSIAFGPAQQAGDVELVLEFDLSSPRDHSRVRVAVPFSVGLETMRVDLRHRVQPRGDGTGDLIVEARVTSAGAGSLTLDLTAHAPGRPRQSAHVSGLPAGESITRQFVFPGAAGLLGQTISVAVEDVATGARLNKLLLVE